MKKTTLVSSETHLHPLHRSARKFRSCAISTLLITAAALLGPGGAQRCAAQFWPPGPYQQDEHTFSIGVFQITVEPDFAYLLAPNSAANYYYPGYSPSSGVLTSPVMYDTDTRISTSATMNYPGTFPVIVGNPAGFGAPGNNPGNKVASLADFCVMPIDFAFPAYAMPTPGPLELFTEIESFDLSCTSDYFQCSPDDRVPLPPGIPLTLVSAGPHSANPPAMFDPTDPLTLPRRSLGMVQQYLNPIEAKSFFNINVRLYLPKVLGNVSEFDFPTVAGYPIEAAELANNPCEPLVVLNQEVKELPPKATYKHGATLAVPLYFVTGNGAYWSAGDKFGSISLAGHGVFACTNRSPTGPPNGESTNCCNQEQVKSLLDTTLGPIGKSEPSMPVGWQRPGNEYPTANATYNSLVNRVTDSRGTMVLDDVMSFTGYSIGIRDVVIGVFPNYIALPAPLNSATFSFAGVPFSCEIVSSGSGIPSAGECSGVMEISNTGLWSQTLTNIIGSPPPVTNYTQVLKNFHYQSSSGPPVYLRLMTNNASKGVHTVRHDPSVQAYEISSFFDVYFELSTDTVHWYRATNSIRLGPNLPPATRPIPPIPVQQPVIHFTWNGTALVLNWSGTNALQNATNVTGPFIDLNGGVPFAGPYTVYPTNNKAGYYRLHTVATTNKAGSYRLKN